MSRLALLVSVIVLAVCGRASAASELCATPAVISGAPTAVVVLIDGATSKEPVSGSAYPFGVPHPASGIPEVSSYCPVDASGNETRWPDGINGGLHVWAQDSDNPDGLAGTTACAAVGGLRTNRCLVARLADTGAVLLPYSYTGATVERTASGPVFHFNGYESADTNQLPATSIERLDGMLRSVVETWPRAKVYVVAHSLGGMIAEGWWQQGQQTHTRPPQIAAIFSLDSPINGLPNCLLARFVVGGDVSAELCSRWNHRDALDQRILALDGDASYIAVGASGDPAYANSLIAGGGNLRPQLVYNCSDSGESPTSSCIATPPSYISPCNPTSPTIEGDGHHLVIACPQVVQLVTSAPGGRPLRFQLQQRCRAHRTVRLTVDGDTWAARRMTYTLGSRRITRAAAPFAATVRRNTIGGRHARRVVGTVSLTRGGTARVSARIRCRSS